VAALVRTVPVARGQMYHQRMGRRTRPSIENPQGVSIPRQRVEVRSVHPPRLPFTVVEIRDPTAAESGIEVLFPGFAELEKTAFCAQGGFIRSGSRAACVPFLFNQHFSGGGVVMRTRTKCTASCWHTCRQRFRRPGERYGLPMQV